MGLWRLRSPFAVLCDPVDDSLPENCLLCSLKAREGWCGFQSRSVGLRTRNMQGRSVYQISQAESEFSLPLPSCSIQALSKLDDAHLYWEGPSALLHQFKCSSLPETLPETPRNNI